MEPYGEVLAAEEAPARGGRVSGARVQIPPSPPDKFSTRRPVGQAVKTPPFHGGNTGSNPVRVTIYLRWAIAAVATDFDSVMRWFEPASPAILFKIFESL